MGFRIEYEALSNLNNDITKNTDMWINGVSPVNKAFDKVSNSPFLEGQLANGINSYFTTVHGQLLQSIKSLVELHQGNFALLYSDFRKIDTDKFARIESKELDSLNTSINSYKNQTDGIESEVASILKGINDIFNYTRTGTRNIVKYETEITTNLKNLKTVINNCDNLHKGNDFTATGNLISSLTELINECYSKNRNYKATFTSTSVSELQAWVTVYTDSDTATETFQMKEADILIANEEADSIAKEIVEYKKREQTAKWTKFIVAGACVALSIVAVVAFPGVGAIAAGAIVGAISGAANKTTEILMDEYTESGNLDKFKDAEERKKALKSIAVATVAGGVTGAISGTFSVATKGVDGVAMKITSEIAEEVVSGMAERKIESTADQVENLITGKTDFRTALEDIHDDTYDMKEIGKDAIKGSISGVTKSTTSYISKNVKYGNTNLYDAKMASNAPINDQIATKSIKSSIDKTITGSIDRYVNKRIDGYSASEAWKDATDSSKVATDVVGGYVGGKAGNYRSALEDVAIPTYATALMF